MFITFLATQEFNLIGFEVDIDVRRIVGEKIVIGREVDANARCNRGCRCRSDGVSAAVRARVPPVVYHAVAAAARHVPHLPALAAGRRRAAAAGAARVRGLAR